MKKKRTVLISVIAALSIVVVIGTVSLWKHISDYSTTLNLNWGFSLPHEAHYSEEYSKDSGASFHGDGIRYHVFSYTEEKPINGMLAWKTGEESTKFYDRYSDAVNEWLSEIDVPGDKLPDYSKCSYWYGSQRDNSEIIVLWDSSKSRIYIAESFL